MVPFSCASAILAVLPPCPNRKPVFWSLLCYARELVMLPNAQALIVRFLTIKKNFAFLIFFSNFELANSDFLKPA